MEARAGWGLFQGAVDKAAHDLWGQHSWLPGVTSVQQALAMTEMRLLPMPCGKGHLSSLSPALLLLLRGQELQKG